VWHTRLQRIQLCYMDTHTHTHIYVYVSSEPLQSRSSTLLQRRSHPLTRTHSLAHSHIHTLTRPHIYLSHIHTFTHLPIRIFTQENTTRTHRLCRKWRCIQGSSPSGCACDVNTVYVYIHTHISSIRTITQSTKHAHT